MRWNECILSSFQGAMDVCMNPAAHGQKKGLPVPPGLRRRAVGVHSRVKCSMWLEEGWLCAECKRKAWEVGEVFLLPQKRAHSLPDQLEQKHVTPSISGLPVPEGIQQSNLNEYGGNTKLQTIFWLQTIKRKVSIIIKVTRGINI